MKRKFSINLCHCDTSSFSFIKTTPIAKTPQPSFKAKKMFYSLYKSLKEETGKHSPANLRYAKFENIKKLPENIFLIQSLEGVPLKKRDSIYRKRVNTSSPTAASIKIPPQGRKIRKPHTRFIHQKSLKIYL